MMDRRLFLTSGAFAAAGLLTGGRFATTLALDTKGSAPSRIVPTTSGKLQGISLNSVYAFKGIP
jgi:hypothetical protein